MSERQSNDGKKRKRKHKSRQRSADQPDEEPSSSNPQRVQELKQEIPSEDSFKDAQSDDSIYYDPRESISTERTASTRDTRKHSARKLKKPTEKTPLQTVPEESNEEIIPTQSKPERTAVETTEGDDKTDEKKVRRRKSKKKPESGSEKKSELKPRPDPIIEAQSKPESALAPKIGPRSQEKSEPAPKKEPRPQQKSEPTPHIEPKPQEKSEPAPKIEPRPKKKSESSPKIEPRSQQMSEPAPDPEPESDPAPMISITLLNEIDDEYGKRPFEAPASVNTEEELRKFKVMNADYEDSDDEEMFQERWADIVRRDANRKPSKDPRKRRSTKKPNRSSTISIISTNLKTGGAFVYMVVPPDGGYGWLILVISFLCQMIVDGIIFSLGITLPVMAEDLGSSPSNIALVASTQIGPISSAFINKFGFRPVAILGATLSMTTITIATFSPNVPVLILFYSVIGGVSLSMIWVSSQLIIGFYFEKYRPIASGVSCSGAGAGVLLFSYINAKISQNYGWRNTTRFHVLCLMIVFLMAWTFIEVAPTRIGRVIEVIDTESDSVGEDDYMHSYRFSRMTWHSIDLTSSKHSRVGIPSRLQEMDEIIYSKPSRMNLCCQACCPPFKRFMQSRMAEETLGDVKPHRFLIEQDPYERQDLFYTGPVDYDDVPRQHSQEVVREGDVDIEVEADDPQMLRAINYKLARMPERDEQRMQRQTVEYDKVWHVKEIKDTEACWEFLSPRHWVHPKIQMAFNMLFDFRLLKLFEFQILLASAFLFPMGMNIPFVYSKERAEIEPSLQEFISPTIGLSNLVFRIASGFMAYKYKSYTTYICGSGIAFGGMVTFISAFYGADVVWFQFIFAISFGVAPAFYSTLRAIIYVRMLGLEKLTNAFGLTAMAMGMGVFIGTYTGGLLFQLTHDYQATFVFSGSCMMLAGSLKLIVPSVVDWKLKKQMSQTKVRFAK